MFAMTAPCWGPGIPGCASRNSASRLGTDKDDGLEPVASGAGARSGDPGDGAHFKSAYELYAHVIVAEHRGLSDEKLATIVRGAAPGRSLAPGSGGV